MLNCVDIFLRKMNMNARQKFSPGGVPKRVLCFMLIERVHQKTAIEGCSSGI